MTETRTARLLAVSLLGAALCLPVAAWAQTPPPEPAAPPATVTTPAEPAKADGVVSSPSPEPAAPPATVTTPAEPAKADGLVSSPPPGKGQVVFYRPSKFAGMAVSFTIQEGGKDVVKLGNGSYYILIADPGAHTFIMQSEVTDTSNVEVEEGETTYLQQTISAGLVMAHPHLIPSNKAKFDAQRAGSMKPAKGKGVDSKAVAAN
jgi:hypothetical protein